MHRRGRGIVTPIARGRLKVPTFFVPLIRPEDLPTGAITPVSTEGRTLLIANVDGQYYAFSPECPHEGADLSRGRLVGAAIRCPNHQYLFGFPDGNLIESDDDACPPLTMFQLEEHAGTISLRVDL